MDGSSRRLQHSTGVAWLDHRLQQRMNDVLATQRHETGLQIEVADDTNYVGMRNRPRGYAAQCRVDSCRHDHSGLTFDVRHSGALSA